MIPATNNPTMSSREIAELTGKRHDNVMRDIEKMCAALNIAALTFEVSYTDSSGKACRCYALPHREVKILITGYDVVRRAKVIDRLEQLEQAIKQLPAMTQAQLIAAIAQQNAEQEQRVTVIEQQVKLLEAKVPHEQEYFTIIGYSRYIGTVVSNTQANALGRRAAKASREAGVPVGETADPRYGRVGTYHEDVLASVFDAYFDQEAA